MQADTPTTNDLPVPAAPRGSRRFSAPAVPIAQAPEVKKSRIPWWLVMLIGVVIGGAIGALVMKHRLQQSDVVMAVNGTRITKAAFYSQLENLYGQDVLTKMINDDLQMEFAKTKGVVVTDDDVNARYEVLKQAPNFNQVLKASGVPFTDYHQYLKMQMVEEGMLGQGVKLTKAQEDEYYRIESNPANPRSLFCLPGTLNLSAINGDTLRNAQAAMAQLEKGVPFAKVAAKYSVDASRQYGGRLIPVQRGTSPLAREPQVEAQVFQLEPGQTLGPIKFENMYWIFHCDTKLPVKVIPQFQVEDQVHDGALMIEGAGVNGAKLEKQFEQFRASAKIQSFWSRYQMNSK